MCWNISCISWAAVNVLRHVTILPVKGSLWAPIWTSTRIRACILPSTCALYHIPLSWTITRIGGEISVIAALVQCKTVYDGCDHLQYSVITAVINNKSPFPPPRSPYLWPVWAGGTKKEHYGFKISCFNTGKWDRVQLEIDQLSKLNRSDERLSSLSIRGKLRAKVPANWWELIIFAEGINYKEISTCMHFIVDINEWIIVCGK